MKIVIIVLRVLLGLLFAFASVAYFFQLFEEPEHTGAMKVFNEGLNASVYLMPTVKALELICALAFLSGRFVPLATLIILPIVVNILGVHVFLEPQGLPVAIFVTIATMVLIWHHRERYKGLLVAKA